MSDYSTFLFARPSFSEGVARLIDFGNTLSEYNASPTSEEADARAFRADMMAVDMDMLYTPEGAFNAQSAPGGPASQAGKRKKRK